MGRVPLTGGWKARNTGDSADYSGALKWGTGINPVHQVKWEGSPLRSTGRMPGPDNPSDRPSTIPGAPFSEGGADVYGYTMDDIASLSGQFVPFTPPYGTEIEVLRGHNYAGMPDWGVDPSDPDRTGFGLRPELAAPLWRGIMIKAFPTESATEGWDNKLTGEVLDAKVSDPAQYERQTSMQQVNPAAGRNNDAAVARGTDDVRFNIMTRLTGMKIKPWSQGERNEDMFPFQQLLGVRPFRYRTAATGNPQWLESNEMYVSEPITRAVPPDPSLGVPETGVSSDYGYTEEDNYYA